MGYRGIGHMGNETHRGRGTGVWGTWPIRPKGYGVQGVWGTWVIGHNGYRGYGVQGVWDTGGMGHMGNGSHGQWAHGQWGPWGTWAMGPMGHWDIFAYNFIITGWILTKILLDIDIGAFYLNTGRFFHDGFI